MKWGYPSISLIVFILRVFSPSTVSANFWPSPGELWHDWFCVGEEVCQVGDVDGDSREDLITFTRGTTGQVYVALSTGQNFSGTGWLWRSGFCAGTAVCKVGDVDGDGKADLIAFTHNGPVWVALSTGTSFGPSSVWHGWFCIGTEVCEVSDVNGDGKADLLAFTHTGPVWVALSTGTSFGPSSVWYGWFCVDAAVCKVGDVDGDGKADLIAFTHNGPVWVALSTGTSFGPSSVWHGWFCIGTEVCEVSDVNGDGKADLLAFTHTGPVWVALSERWRFASSSIWHDWFCIEDEVCRVGDINGDGRADIIAFVRRNEGDVFVALSEATSPHANACVPDVQGQLLGLPSKPEKLGLWYKTEEDRDLTDPPFPINLTEIEDKCHIQGVQRLHIPGYIAYVANSRARNSDFFTNLLNHCDSLSLDKGDGAHLFVAKMDSKTWEGDEAWRANRGADLFGVFSGAPQSDRNILNFLLSHKETFKTKIEMPPNTWDWNWPNFSIPLQPPTPENFDHPGGFQILGNLLFVGIGEGGDSIVRILDMTSPQNPVDKANLFLLDHDTETLGTVVLPDGRILMVAGYSHGDLFFYRERQAGGNLSSQNFERVARWSLESQSQAWNKDKFGYGEYQSTNLMKECGTNRIYMLGIANHGDLKCPGADIGSLLGTTSNFTEADLYEVHNALSPGNHINITLEKVARRKLDSANGAGCAGTGIYINDEGRLRLYLMEHDGRNQPAGTQQSPWGPIPTFYKRGVVPFDEFSAP